VVVEGVEDHLGDHVPVILYPSPDDRVEQADQVFRFGLGVSFDDLADLPYQFSDAFLGRFDEQFVAILAHILADEIEPVFDMGDDRFLLREFQAALTEELFHQWLDHHQQKHLGVSGDDKIVSEAHQVDLDAVAFPTFGKSFLEELLQAIQGHIG